MISDDELLGRPKKAVNKYGITAKNLGGQPRAFTPEGWRDVFLEYLEDRGAKQFVKKEAVKGGLLAGTTMDVPTDLPLSIESFCVFAGVVKQTFHNYERRAGYEEYFNLTARMREIIQAEQIDGATVGAYNQNIIAYRLGLMKKDGDVSDSEPDSLERYKTKADEANIVYLLNVRNEARIRVNRGGTRSSKTYSLAQIALDWLLTGKVGDKTINEGAFDIVRKTLPALKASVLKDLAHLILERGLNKIVKHHKTDKSFSIKNTPRQINYFSVDDEHKVRGSKRKILWINEADGVNYDDFRQLNMRGVELCFLDFNPSKYDTWIKKEIEQKRFKEKKDVSIITSTYEDNLFLTPQEVEEIEYLAKGNPDFWKVFGKGEYAKLAGVVYPDWELYDGTTFDHAVENSKTVDTLGIDFGYTAPTAIIKIHVDIAKKIIYLNEIAYKTHLGTSEIASIIKREAPSIPAVCDAAEPRTIGELKKQGCTYAIKCAKKSTVSDIRRINGYRLIVREGSSNLTREFNSYHRPSKDGEIIGEEPVPINDHAMDGFRYGAIYALNISKAK